MARYRSSNAGPSTLLRTDVPHASSSTAASSGRPFTSINSSHSNGTGGKGKGKTSGAKGLGLGGKTLKRHRKILRDNIQGVTKGDIRRLARRGGVKRISSMIYDETRAVLRRHLESVSEACCAVFVGGDTD